ncbi:RNA-binding protein [Paenibacillus yonginensis]|uniref:RNA-binding protein n=1 Tax=Paenibacillus yonginensis TaxID=1462996 RepID=A0A1B1MYY3_9BACL|nr:CGNR zinc finger domain-containing protein [Paenibacillus yonginensis]ANS74390.1 RNA-binding protein [Paenibacillus yonginensis]
MTDHHKFPLLAGSLSLDLVNTELVRRGRRYELLLTEADLLHWVDTMLGEGTLYKASLGSRSIQTEQEFQQVLEFRAIVREHFESIAAGEEIAEDFIALLERSIEKAPFQYKLLSGHLVPVPAGETAADVLIALAAYDALSLMAQSKLGTLKHCSNPDCVLLFMDDSGKRKWCSMKICGNRSKAARFKSQKSSNA